MSVTIITTPKATNANCYVELAAAKAYMANRLNTSVWDAAADDDVRSRALIQATSHLEQLIEWDGEMVGQRANLLQALRFPAIGVLTRNKDFYYDYLAYPYPPFLQTACYEQALVELTNDR